jgi:hypothetical protein
MDKRDAATIRKLIDAEEGLWSASPTQANFENIYMIAATLAHAKPDTEEYWLFRQLVWRAILDPIPPIHAREEIRAVLDQKDRLLGLALSSSFTPALSGSADVTTRHDAAMMLMSYAGWLRQQIIPHYKAKPVAPRNDSAVNQELTRQNFVDNSIQEALQEEVWGLSGHVMQLTYAYHAEPKDYEEAKALVEALGIKGPNRDRILNSAK